MKQPSDVRAKIADFLSTRFGLSSTGSVALIGVYPGPGYYQHMFHFQQADRFGAHLVWSVWVSPEMIEARVLYDLRSKEGEADWIKID
jgi:hypothetical protein